MKISVLLAIAGSLLLSATVHAQSRLWTWTPTKPDGYLVYSNLQSSYIDGDGDTGLAYLELHQKISDNSETVKLRLAWISNSGRVRKDFLVDTTEASGAIVFSGNSVGTYRILFASHDKWVATNGTTIWTARFDEKTKTVSTTTSTVPEGVKIQAAQQPPAFPGWIQKEVTNEDNGPLADNIISLSLWRVKN